MKTEEYLKKIYTMLIVVLVISIMSLLIGLVNYSNTKGTTNNNSSTTTNNGSSTNNYDVSMFNEVSVSDILKFLGTSNKDTHILYLGRSTCSACVAFLPNLQATQSEMNFTTDYLDITKVEMSIASFLGHIKYADSYHFKNKCFNKMKFKSSYNNQNCIS